MTGYEDGPRPLSWPLLHPLVGSRTVEDDPDLGASSFVWPDDPDERVFVGYWLSYNEWKVLGSAIDVGSDIAFGVDALRVMWLWMRNMRINVPICDAVNDCIENNPTTITTIVNKLISNVTFNNYLVNLITTTAPGGGGNVYPPRPTSATPDPLCNAATYLVAQLRELIVGIYNDLETFTPDEILASILGLFGWRSSPLYQLIGLLETNEYDDFIAQFDDAAPDLTCELIEAELDQAPVLAWVALEYPPPSVLGDALTLAIQSAADDGKWAQWIAVGALKTGATCNCNVGWCYRIPFKQTNGSGQGVVLTVTAPGIPEFNASQWVLDVGLTNVDPANADRTFASIIRPDIAITRARLEWEYVDNSGSGNVWMDNDYGAPSPVSFPQVSLEREYGNVTLDNFIFGGERPGSDFTPFINITAITLWGDDEVNPFGTSNC